jgi:alkylation response protein AidB-like acyl-CoA dehydrogenase
VIAAEDSLRDDAAAFARQELAELDGDGEFSREVWRRCAAAGIQGLPVPPEDGGRGLGASGIAATLEGLGYGCRDNGLVFALNAQLWGCELPLVRFGSEEQKRRWLPGLCDGSLVGAHAVTEPGAGSDALALATTATRSGDGWILRGEKTLVTNGPVADVFVVLARTDPGLGFAGLSAFLVGRDASDLEIGPPLAKMGLRSAPLGGLALRDCEVPAAALLGGLGSGLSIFALSMRWERTLILAGALGTMRRQLERTVARARDREQFGRPLLEFQAVSHRLVEMKLRLETSRLLLYRTAQLLDSDAAADGDAALTKLHVSESFLQSSLDALQLHGGSGYLTETGLERDVRDAVASRLYSGTSEMQRNLVASQLGL